VPTRGFTAGYNYRDTGSLGYRKTYRGSYFKPFGIRSDNIGQSAFDGIRDGAITNVQSYNTFVSHIIGDPQLTLIHKAARTQKGIDFFYLNEDWVFSVLLKHIFAALGSGQVSECNCDAFVKDEGSSTDNRLIVYYFTLSQVYFYAALPAHLQ
jgi:hypothetical protein